MAADNGRPSSRLTGETPGRPAGRQWSAAMRGRGWSTSGASERTPRDRPTSTSSRRSPLATSPPRTSVSQGNRAPFDVVSLKSPRQLCVDQRMPPFREPHFFHFLAARVSPTPAGLGSYINSMPVIKTREGPPSRLPVREGRRPTALPALQPHFQRPQTWPQEQRPSQAMGAATGSLQQCRLGPAWWFLVTNV
jgi:hypothetical protein